MHRHIGIILITLTFSVAVVLTENLPCISRLENSGYICVCNETYCDTIETPSPLPSGSYYHYSTAERSPGFTQNIGKFDNDFKNTSEYDNSKDVLITINSSTIYQTFKGIGASFTGSSGIVFNTLSEGAKQRFIESYFSAKGIEYTFARVPIGGSDFSLHPYTHDDVPGDLELKHFNLSDEDYNNKIPVIKLAQAASTRGLNLIGSPWTAPTWMKTNNATDQGYLCNKYKKSYALYLIKFFEAYQNLSIEFWGLTGGNEVVIPLFFGKFFPIPNLSMMPTQTRFWTKQFLGPMLKQSKFKNIKLLTLDDERPFMTWWSSRIFRDKEVLKYVDGMALHWYFDSSKTISLLEQFHKDFPNKFIFYTESSIGKFMDGDASVKLGDWTRGVLYINSIFQNFGHWVVGYLDWNMALDESGGPSGPSNITLESAIIINTTNGEFYKQPIFYILGHFSKFILPGSKRVDTTIDQGISGPANMEKSIWREIMEEREFLESREGPPPTGSPLPTGPEPPSTDVLALATINPDGSRTLITYNPRPDPVNLVVKDSTAGSFQREVEPHSLNTFVYWP